VDVYLTVPVNFDLYLRYEDFLSKPVESASQSIIALNMIHSCGSATTYGTNNIDGYRAVYNVSNAKKDSVAIGQSMDHHQSINEIVRLRLARANLLPRKVRTFQQSTSVSLPCDQLREIWKFCETRAARFGYVYPTTLLV
jgi:hypothetical protein